MSPLTTITDRVHGARRIAKQTNKKLPPLHPGEVLREEFLGPLGLSPGALAKAMGVPRTRVERIAAETIGIPADTALRLSRALGTSAQLWLNLQNRYDMEVAERAIGRELAKIGRVTGKAGRQVKSPHAWPASREATQNQAPRTPS